MKSPSSGELVVYDALEVCPYFADRTARLPMRLPTRQLTDEDFDDRLAAGDRRNGNFLYRASCPACTACEAIRLDVREFRPDQTQRRIERRGSRLFSIAIQRPAVDAQRVRLFNEHRWHRGLASVAESVNEPAYQAFLCDTCCNTFEIAYDYEGRLAAVAICDRGRSVLSAVYCYFDAALSHASPGVFSILTQVRLCREWGLRYLYLGYYIAESRHMCYKARYYPHERRIAGEWRRFDGPA